MVLGGFSMELACFLDMPTLTYACVLTREIERLDPLLCTARLGQRRGLEENLVDVAPPPVFAWLE